jgi:hypothetical protein
MHERTRATLAELENHDWFSAVGQKDTEAAIVLSSWKEAIASCKSDEWQDLLLEAANRYTEKLAGISPERFQSWNLIVREVKPFTMPLVARKIEHVQTANKLPKIFAATVNWDILHVCMEAEYADVFPPGFFASQAYWYVHGHFPCGWQGNFPEGKLIIF